MLKIANQTYYHKQLARKLVESVRDYPLQQPLELRIDDSELIFCCDIHSQKTCYAHSFLNPKLRQRSKQKNQLLLKACNNKKHEIKTIVDLTAGWGKDSFMLATQGQTVTMVEQNLLLYHCLDYLLNIARVDKHEPVFDRLQIIHQNSVDYLSNLQDEKPDCLYLDPMFPAHKSNALPAKDLQILQLLTGNQDMSVLFELALSRARHRVVVKRPVHSPALNDRKADIIYREKTIRFDVYLTTNS